MRRLFILAGVFSILLAGCASQPQVRVDRDPTVDLKSYKTFAFFDRLPSPGERYTTLMNKRLNVTTRYELEKQGYTYDEQNPDLRVNVVVHLARRQEIPSSPGYRRLAGLETTQYREGTLTIDLVDTRKNAMVWQGAAEGRIDEQTAMDPAFVIETTIKQIFAGFPDGTRK